ncbi:MAG TPA: hypothetical protein VGR00_05760, partial [Thermoanaerobaculia bacterium]|nr:hypothetical protein [Thermoanaerobaculia bacterium]
MVLISPAGALRQPAAGTEFPCGGGRAPVTPSRGERRISKLTVVRLNDPEEEENPLSPWPPPGGLPEGEDPFAAIGSSASGDLFVPTALAKEAAERAERLRFTTERAIYISVILHLLLVLFFVLKPPSIEKPVPLENQPDPLGLIKLLRPTTPEPIPIQFFPAPGKAAPKPGPRPLPSDLDRVAHGGAPNLPKASQPRSVAKAGIQDLAQGKRGEESVSPRDSEEPAPAPRSATGGLPSSSPPKLSGIPTSALAQITPEQAAAAARGAAGTGDGGAGFEREGGFVDSGPLSFDT